METSFCQELSEAVIEKLQAARGLISQLGETSVSLSYRQTVFPFCLVTHMQRHFLFPHGRSPAWGSRFHGVSQGYQGLLGRDPAPRGTLAWLWELTWGGMCVE